MQAAQRRNPTKKSGAGSRSWGVPGLDDLKLANGAFFNEARGDDADDDDIDADDNDVDLSTRNVVFTVVALDPQDDFKAGCRAALADFFVSEDIPALVDDIHALAEPHWAYEFVKQALVAALARPNRDREAVSRMFSALDGTVLPSPHIRAGFNLALDRVADLALDTPDASNLLACFIARAVVDDVLPPAFVSAPRNYGRPAATADPDADALVRATLQRAQALLADKNSVERVEQIWGPSAAQSVHKLKESIALLVREFLDTGDADEVGRSLRELHVQHFHYQLVKLVVDLFIESTKAADRDSLLGLLVSLARSAVLSDAALRIGFQIAVDNVADLATDISAQAPQTLLSLIAECVKSGLLPAEFDAQAKELIPARMQEEKERRATYRALMKQSQELAAAQNDN